MKDLDSKMIAMIEQNSRDNAELAKEKIQFIDRMMTNIIADQSIDPLPEKKQEMVDLLNDIKLDYLAFTQPKDKMPWEK